MSSATDYDWDDYDEDWDEDDDDWDDDYWAAAEDRADDLDEDD
jgi:hypothetical protein